jgi:hypothetical protein
LTAGAFDYGQSTECLASDIDETGHGCSSCERLFSSDGPAMARWPVAHFSMDGSDE